MSRSKKAKALEEELELALTRLLNSYQYRNLRDLKVAYLLPEGSIINSLFKEHSLAELVGEGAAKIVSEIDDSNTIKKLTELLYSLGSENFAEQPTAKLDELPAQMEETVLPVDTGSEGEEKSFKERYEERKNSVEDELILTDIYNKLRSAACFDSVKNLSVGRYWDTNGVRDPFLEEMTFAQLLSIKVEHLLEKRSITDTKISAVVDAIKRCLAGHDVVVDEEVEPEREFSFDNRCEFRTGSGDAPIVAPVLAEYKVMLASVSGLHSEIAKIIQGLPKYLTAGEYAKLWLIEVYGFKYSAPLFSITEKHLKQSYSEILEKLKENAFKIAPLLNAHWEGALNSVGINFESLCEAHLEPLLNKEYQKMLFKALLKALKAETIKPELFGERYWTFAPELFPVIVEKIKAGGNAKHLMPFFDEEDIKIALS